MSIIQVNTVIHHTAKGNIQMSAQIRVNFTDLHGPFIGWEIVVANQSKLARRLFSIVHWYMPKVFCIVF